MLVSSALAILLAAPGARCVEIAAISDLHGRVAEMPVLAARVAAVRAKGPSLALDAGDGLQGTIEALASKGEAVVAGYGAMGLDAAAVGNHDFDEGQAVLRARIAGASYPFLAANVRVRATGRPLPWRNLRASRLFRPPGGPVVGVIGLSGEDTPYVTMPRNVAGLAFTSAARAATWQAARLRAAGAEVVVAIAHIGGRCGDLSDPDDLSSCDPSSDLFRLARALPPGTVDLVIGGHTHALVNHRVNGTALVQPGARAEFLGWATLCAGEPARLHPLVRVARRNGDPPEVEPDARVAAAIAPYLAMARAEGERPLGVRLEAPLRRDRNALSPFGAAAATSMREVLKTDFALMNAGALRVDLPAGELTYGQLYEAIPFDDDLAVIRIGGTDLEVLLRLLARGNKGFPQTSGLRFDGREVRGCDGAPLDPARTYTLGTNEFLAVGGDGVGPILARLGPDNVKMREDLQLRDAFLEWLRKAPPGLTPAPCP
jgi:5'-nucleotidase